MNLLLDTHALLWWLADEPLDDVAATRIADPAVLVAVSSASIWEIGIKALIGKLRFAGQIVEHLEQSEFEPLPISWAHAERACALPPHHRDPFDRLLVAQAQMEGLTLVTRDRHLSLYDVGILPC